MALGVEPNVVWANPDLFMDKPFYEIINFADNEGTIGPEAARDLAEDFRNFHAQAREIPDSYFIELYETWMTACADAADCGMIEFH
jgi:hypothetical protein